jgi:methyltransferase (TIGR00027 family)
MGGVALPSADRDQGRGGRCEPVRSPSLALHQKSRTRTARNTAEAFASLRAAGASVRDRQVRNPDYLASKFVAFGPRMTTAVKLPALRPLARKAAERVSPGAYHYELARVKHIDGVLSEGLESGIEQLVILGAGFDTRAYRFADRLSSTRVFELDHPVTAALKQARVRKVFGELPEHVTYVTSDLEHDELAVALDRCGYRPAAKTLFVWSGVSFYLSAEAVDSVLAFVPASSPAGSSIVFDYHYRGFTDGTGDYYGAREGRRRVQELGEPCIFGIEEGGAATLVQRHGLELVSDLGPAELERRYLIRSNGSADGRPFGFISIAHARVPVVGQR